MDLLVRDDVVGVGQALEPGEKEEVDGEVAKTAREPVRIMGTDVEERTPAAAVANRAPILVPIVAGQAKFGVRVDERLVVRDNAFVSHDRAHIGRREMVVGVGEVGVGRRDEQDVSALVYRADEQRVEIHAFPGLKAHRIDAAPEILRQFEGEIVPPTPSSSMSSEWK